MQNISLSVIGLFYLHSYMSGLYLPSPPSLHTLAWSSPSCSRCPKIGTAPGISGSPFMYGMSVDVDN